MITNIVMLIVLTGLGITAANLYLAESPQPQPSNTPAPITSPLPSHNAHNTQPSLTAFTTQDFSGTDFTLGPILEENSAYTRHYITYQSGDLTISGIMNIPRGAGPFPVLLLNHGYIDPAIYTNGRGLKREQDYLARQGFVVLHSDYRNHADSDKDPNTETNFRLGYAEDVINAIHALKAANLPRIDTDRIGMLGHSMGGGVAWTIATTHPDLVNAYVLFAPVSADTRDNFNKWTRTRPEVAEHILTTHGAPGTNPAFWDNISPQTFFDNITRPILIHHGTADESVPLEWSQYSVQQLQAKQKDVTFEIYPDEPHEFTAAWPQVMQRTTDFFNNNL